MTRRMCPELTSNGGIQLPGKQHKLSTIHKSTDTKELAISRNNTVAFWLKFKAQLIDIFVRYFVKLLKRKNNIIVKQIYLFSGARQTGAF
jgi:hypothetical protein